MVVVVVNAVKKEVVAVYGRVVPRLPSIFIGTIILIHRLLLFHFCSVINKMSFL